MTTSLLRSSLAERLRSEIDGAADGTVAVLAGHFAIFTAGGKALDLLAAAHASVGVPAELLEFTRVTWTTACEAIAAERRRRVRLLVLVDDVQFVRPAVEDRGTAERLGATLAACYMKDNHSLPAWHSRVLGENGLGEESILARSDGRWMFSERELRTELVRNLKKALRSGDSRVSALTANADRSTITITEPEYGEYCLVHSGQTNCAGGYVELLSDIRQRGVRKLISLVPMRCLGPITVGTALATRLFELDGLQVVNIAVPDARA
jgi:hypothetical protein